MDPDLTSDLQDGSFDSNSPAHVPNNGDGGAGMQTPPGAQPVHGDATRADQQPDKAAPDAATVSLRDTLTSAFKGEDGKPAAQADATTAAIAPTPAAPVLTQDAEGRYRHADGTFATTEQIAAFTAPTAPQADANTSLAGFTPAEQEQFKSLPAELQQLVARRMEDLDTRAARYAEYDLLEQVIGPRREAWANDGGATPAVAINQLLALSDFAGRDPGQFALWFADQHKLDLDALLDARDAQAGTVNPEVQGLQQTVQQLQQTVQQLTAQPQQQAQEQRVQLLEQFATEKDGAGQPLRPYFADVANTLGAFVASIRSANPTMPDIEVLKRAYENACWSDTNVRTKMQAATETQRQEAARAKAAQAKQAGSSVTGGPAGDPSTIPNNSSRTLRDELQAQFAAQRV